MYLKPLRFSLLVAALLSVLLVNHGWLAPAAAQETETGSESEPLLLAPDWRAVGDNRDDLGGSVATVGDVNGDGYDDLLVGTRNGGLLYAGGSDGLSTEPIASLRELVDGFFRATVTTGAGDVDGDGFDDLLVASPFVSAGERRGAGQVRLFAGSADGLAQSVQQRDGSDAGDALGYSVAAGDLDADGLIDLAVGSPRDFQSTRGGQVEIFYGDGLGLDTETDPQILTSPEETSRYGDALAVVGDINGDGFDDLAVGGGGSLAVFLYYGGPDGVPSVPDLALRRGQYDFIFGRSIAGLGDVNGDGIDDLAVAAQNIDDTAKIHIYYGSTEGPYTTSDQVLVQPVGDQRPDVQVSAAGDVNGDGYNDLLFGIAVERSDSDPGRVYLYAGGDGEISATPIAHIEGASAGAGFGLALTGGGDFNGDGLSDIAIGAPDQADGGAVYALYGRERLSEAAVVAPAPAAEGPLLAPDRYFSSYRERGAFLQSDSSDPVAYIDEAIFRVGGVVSTEGESRGYTVMAQQPFDSGEPADTFSLYREADQVYTIEDGELVPFDESTDPFESYVLLTLMDEILLENYTLDQAEFAGEEMVGSYRTRRYRLDGASLARQIEERLGDILTDAPTQATIDVWVTDENVLTRFDVTFSLERLTARWYWELGGASTDSADLAIAEDVDAVATGRTPRLTHYAQTFDAPEASGRRLFLPQEVLFSFQVEGSLDVFIQGEPSNERREQAFQGAVARQFNGNGYDWFYSIDSEERIDQEVTEEGEVFVYRLDGQALAVTSEGVTFLETPDLPAPVDVIEVLNQMVIDTHSPAVSQVLSQRSFRGLNATEYDLVNEPFAEALSTFLETTPSIVEGSFWIVEEGSYLAALELYLVYEEDGDEVEVELGWEVEDPQQVAAIQLPSAVRTMLLQSSQANAVAPTQAPPIAESTPTPTPTAETPAVPPTATPTATAQTPPTSRSLQQMTDPRLVLPAFEAEGRRTDQFYTDSQSEPVLEEEGTISLYFTASDGLFGGDVVQVADTVGVESAYVERYDVGDTTTAFIRLELPVQSEADVSDEESATVEGSGWVRFQRGRAFLVLDEGPQLIDDVLSIAVESGDVELVGRDQVEGVSALQFRVRGADIFALSNLAPDDPAQGRVTSAEMMLWVSEEEGYPLALSLEAEIEGVPLPGDELVRATKRSLIEFSLAPDDPVELAAPGGLSEINTTNVPGFANNSFPLPDDAIAITLADITWVQSQQSAGRIGRFYRDALRAAGWRIARDQLISLTIEKDDTTLEVSILPMLDGAVGTLVLIAPPARMVEILGD